MAIFRRGPGESNARVWKNCDFRPIYRFISEMIQYRAIRKVDRNPKLSNGTISNDHACDLAQCSMTRTRSLSATAGLLVICRDWHRQVCVVRRRRTRPMTTSSRRLYAATLVHWSSQSTTSGITTRVRRAVLTPSTTLTFHAYHVIAHVGWVHVHCFVYSCLSLCSVLLKIYCVVPHPCVCCIFSFWFFKRLTLL